MGQKMDNEKPYLVIGVDFGTTYSGAAWALSTRPNDIDIITEWESETGQNTNSAKIKSSISYSENGITSWGFDHDPDDIEVLLFKLLLCEEAKENLTEDGLRDIEDRMKAVNKTALDVTADYLRKLWEHVTQILKSKLGASLFETLPIQLVLTVPAIWDHQAQELTKKAAKMAGVTRRSNLELELVSEPEAAARYVLNEDLLLKVGDAFVVCDAGGGTIDLVSFQVEQIAPLRLKMCTKVTGDLFGATFLDDAFEQHVKSVLGSEVYDAIPLRNKIKLISDWEHGIKRNFKHSQRPDKAWYIDIPGLSRLTQPPPSYAASTTGELSETTETLSNDSSFAEDWSNADALILKTQELNDIFGKVCPRIVELVQEQVQELTKCTSSKPKAIFLVGGFGANRYLKEELETSFPNIEIRQPKDAWSSICRGAVLKGMTDEIVTNYISRYHYGICYRTTFDVSKHRREDKKWCDITREWYAADQMIWYLSQGESVKKDAYVTHSWCRYLANAHELTCSTNIYYSLRLVAPNRRNLDVLKLCTLTPTFDTKVWDELPEYTNDIGNKYRTLKFDLQMKVSGSGLQWSYLYNGKSCASLTVDMNMDHHEYGEN